MKVWLDGEITQVVCHHHVSFTLTPFSLSLFTYRAKRSFTKTIKTAADDG